MTTSKQLALQLVREVIADKRSRGVVPDYALRSEISVRLGQVLDALVADGSLIQRKASVNQYPAYIIPQAPTSTSTTSSHEHRFNRRRQSQLPQLRPDEDFGLS